MAKFSHDDAFPVIARLIRELSAPQDRFVTHAQLIDALIRDSSGAKLVESAAAHPGNDWSPQQWASNMVQWFSQKITSESSEYAREFEREKRADGYAYRSTRG